MSQDAPNIPDIPTIDELLEAYNSLVEDVDFKVQDRQRASGGIERSIKGSFVEAFARGLVKRAWFNLTGDISDLRTNKGAVTVPLKKDYLKRVQDKEVAGYIKKNIKDYSYKFKIDVPVYIRENLVMAIECKSYAENAMIKRVLIDGSFIKEMSPDAEVVLFQFESQLGGDYSDIFKEKKFGSASTHTLMSYFDYTLHIITLLEGDRKVNQPIHKKEFFKPMKREILEDALAFFTTHLKKHR